MPPKASGRPVRIEDDRAYVPLGRGLEAIIDGDMAERVAARKWTAKPERTGCFYAMTHRLKGEIGPSTIMLHRFILGVTDGRTWVDHRDGNTLDCRRSNLRPCTPLQSAANRGPHRDGSGIKGVCWSRATHKWQAEIFLDGRLKYLGQYDSIEDAAEAYRVEAIKAHGEFARVG